MSTPPPQKKKQLTCPYFHAWVFVARNFWKKHLHLKISEIPMLTAPNNDISWYASRSSYFSSRSSRSALGRFIDFMYTWCFFCLNERKNTWTILHYIYIRSETVYSFAQNQSSLVKEMGQHILNVNGPYPFDRSGTPMAWNPLFSIGGTRWAPTTYKWGEITLLIDTYWGCITNLMFITCTKAHLVHLGSSWYIMFKGYVFFPARKGFLRRTPSRLRKKQK